MKLQELLFLFILMSISMSCDAKNEKRPVVLFETNQGEIQVELYNETPKHRDNLLKLVKERYYDGVLFHRVIKDFMIQTGDPDSKNARAGQSLGTGGPAYKIDAEIVYPRFIHKRGALAAARQGDQTNPERASSGSQFYIVWGNKVDSNVLKKMQEQLRSQVVSKYFYEMAGQKRAVIDSLQKAGNKDALYDLQEKLIQEAEAKAAADSIPTLSQEQIDIYQNIGGTPHLDNQYTVFGEVIKGLEVVEKIQNTATGSMDRPKEDIRIIKAKIVRQ